MNKSKERKKLDKKLLKIWKEIAKNRDERCQFCGSTNKLTVHHIISRKWKLKRYSPDNALTLCMYCHIEEKAQPKKFKEKVIKAIGETRYNKLQTYKKSYKPTIQELEEVLSKLKEIKREK